MAKDLFSEQREKIIKNILNTIIKGDCVKKLQQIPLKILKIVL